MRRERKRDGTKGRGSGRDGNLDKKIDEEGTEDNQKMSKDDSEGGVTEGEGTPP